MISDLVGKLLVLEISSFHHRVPCYLGEGLQTWIALLILALLQLHPNSMCNTTGHALPFEALYMVGDETCQ